jgi:hypothetical protein
MKIMESPSAVGVAVATAKVDPGATTTTMTETRVTVAMVHHMQIPSHYRFLHQRTIIEKRTGGLSRAARLRHLPLGWSPTSFV